MGYDAWRTGAYDSYFDEHNGWYSNDEFDVESARQYLMDLIEAVFVTGNVYDIETAIIEIAACLKVPCDHDKSLIEKKNENRLMHWYLGYQRRYIDDMKKLDAQEIQESNEDLEDKFNFLMEMTGDK